MNILQTLPLAVDAHVHIHACFDMARFLDAAFANSLEAARGKGGGEFHVPVLLLTEGRKQRAFRGIAQGIRSGDAAAVGNAGDRYRVLETEEEESLRVDRADGRSLYLVSGRQIVTEERLEVLALGTVSEIRDGETLDRTVSSLAREGVPSVVPWGFGKWSGRRGRILESFLARRPGSGFFLGDNGGRPAFLPAPSLFAAGRKQGIRILPGSDPLPFPAEADRPCSYGFTLRLPLDPGRPARTIREALLDSSREFEPFGRLETLLRFVRNQLAMQIVKDRG